MLSYEGGTVYENCVTVSACETNTKSAFAESEIGLFETAAVICVRCGVVGAGTDTVSGTDGRNPFCSVHCVSERELGAALCGKSKGINNENKLPLKRGEVNSIFLVRKTQKGW